MRGWRHLPIRANSHPALGCYLWNDDTGAYLSWLISVPTLRGERVAEITSFIDPDHFVPFGPPASLL